MVSGTIQVGKLFGWYRNFEVDKDENIIKVIYFPNENVQLHLEPSPESIAILQGIRDQLKTIMQQEVTLDGTLLERWEKQLVDVPDNQKEEWVQTYP